MKVRVFSSVADPADPIDVTFEGSAASIMHAVMGFIREDGMYENALPAFFLTVERLFEWIEGTTVYRVEVLAP